MRISVYEQGWFGSSILTDHSFPWKSKSISCRTSLPIAPTRQRTACKSSRKVLRKIRSCFFHSESYFYPRHPTASSKSFSMLLFPPSSIQEPLRDSTNRKHLDHSNGSWPSTSKKSCYLTDLGISEVSSSDISIYNASRAPSCVSDIASDSSRHHSSRHTTAANHETQPLHARAKSEGNAQNDMVRFVNRPHGTPLFTIAEQRSLATLRTQMSFASFRRQGLTSFVTASSGKPKATSVDDTVLYTSRRGLSRVTQTSSSLDVPSPGADPVHPWQPPFVPPHRVKTPEGVPHWPAKARVSFVRTMARTLSTATSLSPVEGTRFVLKTLRGEVRLRRRPQPLSWRPPVSGHSTYHYDQPFQHPLNSVQFAEVISPDHDRPDDTQTPLIPEPTLAERQSLDRRCRSRSASASLARRALGAIDGNAIPVNPARAIRARSVSIPHNLRISEVGSSTRSHTQNQMQTDQSTRAYPPDTLRTIDMIESFPSPPFRPPTKTRDSLPLFTPVPQRPPFAHFLGGRNSTTDRSAANQD